MLLLPIKCVLCGKEIIARIDNNTRHKESINEYSNRLYVLKNIGNNSFNCDLELKCFECHHHIRINMDIDFLMD